VYIRNSIICPTGTVAVTKQHHPTHRSILRYSLCYSRS